MGAAAVLVMATVVGGSLAADQVSGDQAVQAPLAATDLSIALDGAAEYPIESAWMPGSTIELNGETGIYSVENTVDGKFFVTARGWEDLSEILKSYEAFQIPITEALVSQYLQKEETARDFTAYYQLYRKYGTDS